MATNDWTDEDDFDDIDDAPQQVDQETKRFRDLRKAKRADEKRIKELTDQLETVTKGQRERIIKEVLDKHGVTSKAARFIANDIQDVTEESVYNYLLDNAEVFGLEVQQQENPQQQIDLAALRQQDIVTQGAQTPNPGMNAEQMLNDATSADDIIRMIQSGNF